MLETLEVKTTLNISKSSNCFNPSHPLKKLLNFLTLTLTPLIFQVRVVYLYVYNYLGIQ